MLTAKSLLDLANGLLHRHLFPSEPEKLPADPLIPFLDMLAVRHPSLFLRLRQCQPPGGYGFQFSLLQEVVTDRLRLPRGRRDLHERQKEITETELAIVDQGDGLSNHLRPLTSLMCGPVGRCSLHPTLLSGRREIAD